MRLVGTEGAYGEELGLSKDWGRRASSAMSGNYGEILRPQYRRRNQN